MNDKHPFGNVSYYGNMLISFAGINWPNETTTPTSYFSLHASIFNAFQSMQDSECLSLYRIIGFFLCLNDVITSIFPILDSGNSLSHNETHKHLKKNH